MQKAMDFLVIAAEKQNGYAVLRETVADKE